MASTRPTSASRKAQQGGPQKSGKCSKCSSFHVYFKPYALDNVTLDGKYVEYVDYVCTDCGYFERYITDKNALSKIVAQAEGPGDWKKAG